MQNNISYAVHLYIYVAFKLKKIVIENDIDYTGYRSNSYMTSLKRLKWTKEIVQDPWCEEI